MGKVKPWRDLFDEGRVGLFEIYNIKVQGDAIGMKVSRCSDEGCYAFGLLDPKDAAQLLLGGRPAKAIYLALPGRVPRLVFYLECQRKSYTLARVVELLKNKFFRMKIRAYPMREDKIYFIGPAFAR